MNLSSLQKLDLSSWVLKDGEIPSGIVELSNLVELDLSRNAFSLLGFSLSRLTRLKILILSECKRLVELPELPSSIAVLEADYCDSLATIGNNCYTNFKCLCEVSFLRNSQVIVNDAGRLVESVFQCTLKMNLISLQKLDLGSRGLKDGEIPSSISELSNLEELDPIQLTRPKIRIRNRLVSSVTVVKGEYCDSLLRKSQGIVNDAGRLVESMLQRTGAMTFVAS